MFATYLSEYVVVLVEPDPVARVAEEVAVALYPYDVEKLYGEETDDPVPPDAVTLIPNCDVPAVEDAAVLPIAGMVLLAF
jgi:hypothetical protein